ncbi:carbohydrate ABC transporter permease [Phytohabitans kaempferiae]|uniref:Carbohydrate ABC transporter permease n=1 Tax=Phytohabitans kaempferiae TaxID=1620943 RepID=A0ABV6MBC8_9ACTN
MVVLAVMALPFAFPTIWMVTASFKPAAEIFVYPPTLLPRAPTGAGYVQAFVDQPFARQYFNSLYIAAVVTLGSMTVASLAGYAFARVRFPGSNVMFVAVVAGLLVPSEVTIVPIFQMFNAVGMNNTHWPLILVSTFGAPCVICTFIMRQFFIALPAELEEAGRLDGVSRFGFWWRVALPLARAPLGAVAIFAFLHAWNMYLEPTVFLSSPELFTLPQALTRFVDVLGSPTWHVQLAAATMTAVPVLLVFLAAQRQFVEGLAHSGLKG